MIGRKVRVYNGEEATFLGWGTEYGETVGIVERESGRPDAINLRSMCFDKSSFDRSIEDENNTPINEPIPLDAAHEVIGPIDFYPDEYWAYIYGNGASPAERRELLYDRVKGSVDKGDRVIKKLLEELGENSE